MTSLSGRRILITGGLGFIGSTLALTALARGAAVVVVDNLLEGCGGRREHLAGAGGGLQVFEHDVRDVEFLSGIVLGCDTIFSLAGKVSHIDSMRNPADDLEHNVRAPLMTLEAVRRGNPRARVIFASTRQVYGVPRYLPVDEGHPLAPVDVNGIHKIAAEQYHGLYAKVYGTRTCCLRFTNVYGPRQLICHNRQGFIGWFIRCAILNEPITLYGDGSQRRDFCYVDDAVDALLRVADADFGAGSVFNVPGADTASLAEFCRLLLGDSGRGRVTLTPFPEEKKRIDIGDFVSDGSRLAALLSWKPAVTLADGLDRTLAFYRERAAEYLSL